MEIEKSVEVRFVDLGVYKTAKEIGQMPQHEIAEAIEKQEAQFRKNETVSHRAGLIIDRLRAGDKLIVHVGKKIRKFELLASDEPARPVDASVVGQLVGRGWLVGVPGAIPKKPKEPTLAQAQAICGKT